MTKKTSNCWRWKYWGAFCALLWLNAVKGLQAASYDDGSSLSKFGEPPSVRCQLILQLVGDSLEGQEVKWSPENTKLSVNLNIPKPFTSQVIQRERIRRMPEGMMSYLSFGVPGLAMFDTEINFQSAARAMASFSVQSHLNPLGRLKSAIDADLLMSGRPQEFIIHLPTEVPFSVLHSFQQLADKVSDVYSEVYAHVSSSRLPMKIYESRVQFLLRKAPLPLVTSSRLSAVILEGPTPRSRGLFDLYPEGRESLDRFLNEVAMHDSEDFHDQVKIWETKKTLSHGEESREFQEFIFEVNTPMQATFQFRLSAFW